MSPLWSEKALAHAAWAKAVDLGLVENDEGKRDEKARGGRSDTRSRR